MPVSLPTSPIGRTPTGRDSVDLPGEDDSKLSLIEILTEMNLESPGQRHQHQLTKNDISSPSIASGPTFVEAEGDLVAEPEESRRKVGGVRLLYLTMYVSSYSFQL